MNIMEQELAQLKAGTPVRFTQQNGQIIEGVIVRNDGQDSLSISVSSQITVRYSQIAGIESSNAFGAINPVQQVQVVQPLQIAAPVQAKAAVPTVQAALKPEDNDSDVDISALLCSIDALKSSFRNMNSDASDILKPVFGKLQSALKNHDRDKVGEALELCWKLMDETGLADEPDVNAFYAVACMMNDEFGNAADAFCYAGDMRRAYLAAYHGAETKGGTGLYRTAGAMSALYLSECHDEFNDEAAGMLEKASEKCGDISGLRYVVSGEYPADVVSALGKAFVHLGMKCGRIVSDVSNLGLCADFLEPYYPETGIADEIASCAPAEPAADSTSSDLAEEEPQDNMKKGTLISWSIFDHRGKIRDEDGKEYKYDLSDIDDGALSKSLLKLETRKDFKEIAVEFEPLRKGGEDRAVRIRKEYVPAPAKPRYVSFRERYEENTVSDYESEISYQRSRLDGSGWEDAFFNIVKDYLELWNRDGDRGYSNELETIVAQYADKLSTSTKNLDLLSQYYMKVQNYPKCLNVLNTLMENCEPGDNSRLLHYILAKKQCYIGLKDLPSAIAQLRDWLDIVKTNKMTERYEFRDSTAFIELAELLFETGDYDGAEKYAARSTCTEERKQTLLAGIAAARSDGSDSADDGYDNDDEDISDDTATMTLSEAYAEYCDDGVLDITDADVADKIASFDRGHLYCLLTWLSAAVRIAAHNIPDRTSAICEEYSAAQAIGCIEKAFGTAFQNPLSECEYTSAHILSIAEGAQKLIPQYSRGLLASAALRTLFAPSEQDYAMDELIRCIEESGAGNDIPALTELLGIMKSFYETTGCAVDSFAGYRSNGNVLDEVIARAEEVRNSIDGKGDIYENQGRVRRLRELMFFDESSELRKCLNIVVENRVGEIKFVRGFMENTFIRSGRKLSAENLDYQKEDAYVSAYWDMARDSLISEGKHVSKPHDNFKGTKRRNVDNSLRKIIDCICDWLAVAEHSANREEAYIKEKYDSIAPGITAKLSEIIEKSTAALSADAPDWGTYSLCMTAEELLAKMNGTYSAKQRKYMFVDFLRGEDILLDDEYLPELQSTFCGRGRMNILSRIRHHAAECTSTLTERVGRIFSPDETEHDFRAARLIRAYAEDIGDSPLAGMKEFDIMDDCLKQAGMRFNSMYQDFSNEMGLCESYGTISDINGEKTAILKLALDWYRITRLTTDYGFYARLLESIRNGISADAAGRGKQLMRQLEDLADKPEYDFGVYPKEMIAALIEDQNYTSAEFMLNCIRHNDTRTVNDYSVEPYNYFSEFVRENSIDLHVFKYPGKTLVDNIYNRYGTNDLGKAMPIITGNVGKETKGGVEMLKSWPRTSPVNHDDLRRLLVRLGFDPESIATDTTTGSIESYRIVCRKRSGKVTYNHPIPAFGSLTETEGFRVACLFGRFNCDGLMSQFRQMNSTPRHTLVLLDYVLNMEERRRLARKIKEEKSFSKTFIVVDRVILFYLAKHYSSDTISRRLMAVTLPFAYYQPFVEASTQTIPAELFTGREQELTQIESPDGANLVYGGRQLGKSALLKMAQHNVDKNGNNDRAVLLDIQYKNYKEAAVLLSQELVTRDILDESCICDNWDDLARHISKRLMDENPETRINYLLIMLDEADEFIKTSAEDNNPPIAALKNLPAGRFKLVMAGLHNLSRFNREMLQGNSNLIHLSSVVVKQFQRPEAIKLLTNTLAYLGFRFDDKVISMILAKTNYYPGLIQFYCQKLLEAMKGDDYAGYSETNTPYYPVSEGHIKKVLSDSAFMNKVNEKLEASLFTEEKGHSHYHIIALIFAYLCYESPNEKKYTVDDLMRVAEEYKITRLTSLNRDKIDELLNEMWDLNIFSKEDEYYRFATEGFRELLGSRERVETAMSDYFEEEKA